MIMVIAPKPGVVRKAQELKKAQYQAAQAADAQKRGPGGPNQKAPPPPEEDDDDDLDEDEINADVDDSDDDDDVTPETPQTPPTPTAT
jgi:hypothetical protein